MTELKQIEIILLEYLENTNLILYSIEKVKEYGFNILRILLDSKDKISTEDLEKVNCYISEKLDELDVFDDLEYMLEVSSVGLEKEIRNKQELENAIGKFLFIKTKEEEQYGTLIEFKDDILDYKINIKGRMKTIKINYSDIVFMRYAVKL